MKLFSFKALALAASLSLALPVSALAAATYGNIVAPGVYFGSGNVNGNWTINTDNNVEVALRAKDRPSGGLTIDGSSGIYHAGGGIFGSNKAEWNYELSVNVRADGTGSNDLVGLIVELSVDTDATAATAFTNLIVLSNWGDNDYWSGVERSGATGTALAGEYGVQVSQNPAFGGSGFGFIPGQGLYDLRLTVRNAAGAVLSQVTTQVQVPEPSSMALVGLALLGAVGAAKRRRA